MYSAFCTATSRKVPRRWWRIWLITATRRRLHVHVCRPARCRRRRQWKRRAPWSRSAPRCHVDRRQSATITRTVLLVKRSFVRHRSRHWSLRRTSTASAGRLVVPSPSTEWLPSQPRVACVKLNANYNISPNSAASRQEYKAVVTCVRRKSFAKL